MLREIPISIHLERLRDLVIFKQFVRLGQVVLDDGQSRRILLRTIES